MKLAIHQPEFMPWPGFFNKMARADLFVIFDHVQFKKRYFENRNRIVSPRGEIDYITAPVFSKGKFAQPINLVELDNTAKWQTKLLTQVYHWYRRAPFFDKYYPELEATVSPARNRLVDLNMDLILFFRKHLGIGTPLAFSSELNVSDRKGSALILEICRQCRTDSYLCGASGADYLALEEFTRNGIEIVWLNYACRPYRQLAPEFVPYLSTLDLLFNHGDASLATLMDGNGTEGDHQCTFSDLTIPIPLQQ